MVRVVSLDWLSSLEPIQPEPYWFRDTRLYAGINASRFENKLDWAKFEMYMGLPTVPDGLDDDALMSNTSETKRSTFPVLGSKQASLSFIEIRDRSRLRLGELPIDGSKLRYLIRRLQNFDHEISPQDYLYEAPGLDTLTRGVLALHEYAKFCGQDLNWQSALENLVSLDTLAELDYASFKRTIWSRTDLLPDAAAEYEYTSFLKELRYSFVSLQHPVLLQICEAIWGNDEYTSITHSFIRKKTGCSKRDSSRFADEVAVLMTERFIPDVSKLGLRYRVVLTPKLRPRIWNAGLVRAYELVNSDYPGFFVYLEPRDSKGPCTDALQDGSLDFAVTRGILSFRLDMWNGKQWNFEPWNPKKKAIDGKEDEWLLKEFNKEEGNIQLTPREAVLLGISWSHRGDEKSRGDLLDLMDFPARSARYCENRIKEKGVLHSFQHPKLCFSGLSDGAVLAARGIEELEDIRNYLLSIVPYCEVYTNAKEGTLWSIMRVPRWRSDLLEGIVTEYLQGLDIRHHIGRIVEETSYRMTLPSRLYDESTETFADPWVLL